MKNINNTIVKDKPLTPRKKYKKDGLLAMRKKNIPIEGGKFMFRISITGNPV